MRVAEVRIVSQLWRRREGDWTLLACTHLASQHADETLTRASVRRFPKGLALDLFVLCGVARLAVLSGKVVTEDDAARWLEARASVGASSASAKAGR